MYPANADKKCGASSRGTLPYRTINRKSFETTPIKIAMFSVADEKPYFAGKRIQSS